MKDKEFLEKQLAKLNKDLEAEVRSEAQMKAIGSDMALVRQKTQKTIRDKIKKIETDIDSQK